MPEVYDQDKDKSEVEQVLLGDWLAKTFDQMGVPKCFQCQKRQEKLNRWHLKVREFLSSTQLSS